jgi:hypothetical protein
VVRDLAAYAELDRAEVVAGARDAGRYQRVRRPLVIDDPGRPDLVAVAGARRRVHVKMLGPAERRRPLAEAASPTGSWPGCWPLMLAAAL